MWGFKGIEKKYGVVVKNKGEWRDDGHFYVTFSIFSADGHCWGADLGRWDVKAECEKYASELLEIKKLKRA